MKGETYSYYLVQFSPKNTRVWLDDSINGRTKLLKRAREIANHGKKHFGKTFNFRIVKITVEVKEAVK